MYIPNQLPDLSEGAQNIANYGAQMSPSEVDRIIFTAFVTGMVSVGLNVVLNRLFRQ